MATERQDRRCPYRKQVCTLEDRSPCPVKALDVWTSLNVRLAAERCQYAGEELEAAHYKGDYGVRVRRRPDKVY